MSISSDEVNFLVYRYLQESGFHHAAFTFGYESFANRSTIPSNDVPPGALVSFIQKGLQYLELEANLTRVPEFNSNGNANANIKGNTGDHVMEGTFGALTPSELITKDIDQLRAVVNGRRDNTNTTTTNTKKGSQNTKRERETNAGNGKQDHGKKNKAENTAGKNKKETNTQSKGKGEIEASNNAQPGTAAKKESKPVQRHTKTNNADITTDKNNTSVEKVENAKKVEKKSDTEMIDVEDEKANVNDLNTGTNTIPKSDVMILKGHTHEVFFCAWNPKASILASGSGDQTARIWQIPDNPPSSSSQSKDKIITPDVTICSHRLDDNGKHEVTTLDWNSSGTLLATGSYDGRASVWNREGKLQYTLDHHNGPIFSMKWNFAGNLLLSGSLDKTAIVWNADSGGIVQQVKFHDAPMLDVDWRNDEQFATCSTDKVICVCQVNHDKPLRRFYGHYNEVNAIEWDPMGNVLASCSDDSTAKIWSMESNDPRCVLSHDKEVYTIKWRRMGQADKSQSSMLATASFDTSVKLWDVEKSTALHILRGHSEPVYTIAFNPDGQYLLSGSFDKCLHVWSVKDGALIKTYQSSGGIFEACWSNDGRKMAACHADNTVSVIDFRM